jgi:hypothetical protein
LGKYFRGKNGSFGLRVLLFCGKKNDREFGFHEKTPIV